MSKEKLDSDKINYMIWRYLIELDYCETAIRLQKEWNMEDPQRLSFAPHVQSHALVSILNRGLIYNMHERRFAASQEYHDSSIDIAAAHKMATTGFFGPVLPPSPQLDEISTLRKHSIDRDRDPALPMLLPPTKKPRTCNGFGQNQLSDQKTCGAVLPKLSDNTDHEQSIEEVQLTVGSDEHAYPSPEQMPTPRAIAVTSGPEQGMQVERVHDLSNDTIYLELSDRSAIKSAVLAHCAFHPQDPSVLAAAGSDALARIWSLKSLSSPVESVAESPGGSIYAPHRDLFDQNIPITTQATALAWAPKGQYLAIASQPSDIGLARVDFWNSDALLVSSNCGIDSPVLDIQWNLSGTACLVISPRNDATDSSIIVIYPALEVLLRHVLPNHNLVEQLLEIVWMSDDDFIVCGGNLLQAFTCDHNHNAIIPGKKYEVPEGEALSQVAYDHETKILATASDTGMIYIWGKDSQMHNFNAHQGLITLLEWQPHPESEPNVNQSERLLASAGEDGAITIWNALSVHIKSKASMTMRSGVSAIAFSPDGTYLAGATSENIFIWRSDSPHIPRATWNRQYEAGWQTPLSSESGPMDDDICSLCWDCKGKRLAYGINNRLALINFMP